jgi:uncharacterized protein (TIGR04255 family)
VSAQPLPDYERPPVVEIVAAVQFRPLPKFAMPEIVAVSHAFDDWRVIDAPEALPPIIEPKPGDPPSQRMNLSLGMPPMRVILSVPSGRWLAQLQQDRIAVQERKTKTRPSFKHAAPQLRKVARLASDALERELLDGEHRAELVEVIYENRIPAGEGWSGFAQLHKVLRAVSARAGAAPYAKIEQMNIGFSYPLFRDEEFAGRLRVLGEPAIVDGEDELRLRLISRRLVNGTALTDVLEDCHADIVNCFTSVTTENMHEVWGRFQ